MENKFLDNGNINETKPQFKSINFACKLILVFNFMCATLRDGLGPLVSVYLVSIRSWDPGYAGIIWTVREISMAVGQIPMGDFIDKTKHKKTLLITVTFVAALCANTIIITDTFWILVLKSVFEGIAASGIDPGKNAITLGITGPERFENQTSKNEMAYHGGYWFLATVSAILAYIIYPNTQWIFITIGVAGIICIISVLLIPSNLINHDIARNIAMDKEKNKSKTVVAYCDILKDVSIMSLVLSVFMFHLANAAVLPLIGQVIANDSDRDGLTYATICIMIAQLVSIPSAWFAERYSKQIGYKIVLCIGFISLTIRIAVILLISIYSDNMKYLIPTQVLDGIGAGIGGLTTITLTRILTAGTGRFNVVFSFAHVGWMLGASFSGILGGFLANINYNLAFLVLGIISIIPSISTTVGIKEPNKQKKALTINGETAGIEINIQCITDTDRMQSVSI